MWLGLSLHDESTYQKPVSTHCFLVSHTNQDCLQMTKSPFNNQNCSKCIIKMPGLRWFPQIWGPVSSTTMAHKNISIQDVSQTRNIKYTQNTEIWQYAMNCFSYNVYLGYVNWCLIFYWDINIFLNINISPTLLTTFWHSFSLIMHIPCHF